MTTEPSRPADRAERQAGQAAAFDQIGARYDEAFPHKEGQLAAADWLVRQLPTGAQVLDVGCGTGLPTARRLADAGLLVTGIDVSSGMLELARANVPEARFHQRDMLDLDRSAGEFDAVVAFFALLMLPRAEIPASLERLHRLLTPGGVLALAMVEADLDDVPISFLGNTIRVSGYLRDELKAVLERAGFTVVELHEHAYAPASDQAPPEVQLFVYCRRDG